MKEIEEELKNSGSSILVFSKTIKEVSENLKVLQKRFGKQADMFHSLNTEEKKNKILEEIKTGKCRILSCTSSLGMGVNILSVKMVIFHGYPRTLTDLIQQGGRAGRDGAASKWLILRLPSDINNPEVAGVVKEALQGQGCIREKILRFFFFVSF